MCIVPHEYRVLHKILDTDNNGSVSEAEIVEAQAVLQKAKREKNKKMQKDLLSKMDVMEFSQYTD